MTLMCLIDQVSWSKKIELLRIAKGWSQAEAADKCGTNQKQFWNWENGKSYPRKNSRKAIAAAFGVPVSEIFQDVDQKKAG